VKRSNVGRRIAPQPAIGRLDGLYPQFPLDSQKPANGRLRRNAPPHIACQNP